MARMTSVVEPGEWQGLIRGRTDGPGDVSIAAFTPGPPGISYSAPFRVIGSDHVDYFVKSLANCPQGGITLVAEFVVASVGRLINAPMIRTVIIEISPLLAGYELLPGKPVAAGLAHASAALEHCDEMGRPNLHARSQDDNRVRHAAVYALFDWCYGSDQQWLYDIDDDRRIYSHDHGLYFPSGWATDPGPLMRAVDDPHPLPDSSAGLSPVALEAAAERLEAVTRTDLAVILNQVPAAWPVTDQMLETLGWFLERRAPAVAVRIRNLTPTS